MATSGAAGPTPDGKRVRFFGRAKGVQIILAVFTAGFWLLVPLTVWLWRTGRRRAASILGGAVGLFVLVVALSGALSSTSSTSSDAASSATTTSATPATAAPAPALAAPAARAKPKPAAPAKPKPNASVDKHTRAYVAQVETCLVTVGLLLLDIQRGQTDTLKLADEATTARDTCDTIRSNLLTMNTDHFDDQAATAWYGVDRLKSGLNAFLAYLDNPVPSKLIEARNKLEEGDQAAAQGIREINSRRKVYGLKPIKV